MRVQLWKQALQLPVSSSQRKRRIWKQQPWKIYNEVWMWSTLSEYLHAYHVVYDSLPLLRFPLSFCGSTFTQVEEGLERLTLEISGTESSYVASTDSPGMYSGADAGGVGALTCVSEHGPICRSVQGLATFDNVALEPRTYAWSFKTTIPANAPSTQKVGRAATIAGGREQGGTWKGSKFVEMSKMASSRLGINRQPIILPEFLKKWVLVETTSWNIISSVPSQLIDDVDNKSINLS